MQCNGIEQSTNEPHLLQSPAYHSGLHVFLVCYHRKMLPMVVYLQARSRAGLCMSIDTHRFSHSYHSPLIGFD